MGSRLKGMIGLHRVEPHDEWPELLPSPIPDASGDPNEMVKVRRWMLDSVDVAHQKELRKARRRGYREAIFTHEWRERMLGAAVALSVATFLAVLRG